MKIRISISMFIIILALRIGLNAQVINYHKECDQFQGFGATRVIQLQSDSADVLSTLVRDGFKPDTSLDKATNIKLTVGDARDNSDTTYILTFQSSRVVGVAVTITASAHIADVEIEKAIARFTAEYGEPFSSSNSGKTIYGWIAQCSNSQSNKVLVSSQFAGSPDEGKKVISMTIARIEEERLRVSVGVPVDNRFHHPDKAVDYGMTYGSGDPGTTFGLSFASKNVFVEYLFIEAKNGSGAETITGIDIGMSYSVAPFLAPFAGVGVYNHKQSSISSNRTVSPTQIAGVKLILGDALWISAAYHSYRGTVVSVGFRSFTE